MRYPPRIKRLALRVRALVSPMGTVEDHLACLAGRTAAEVGFTAEVSRRFEVAVQETCLETGLTSTAENRA